MYQIKYECGYTMFLKLRCNWARVDDSNGSTVYEGTHDGAVAWLAARGVCALSAGSTHQERLANVPHK
jgi:hypothetical protein